MGTTLLAGFGKTRKPRPSGLILVILVRTESGVGLYSRGWVVLERTLQGPHVGKATRPEIVDQRQPPGVGFFNTP